MQVEFVFKKLINAKGYYGGIILDVEVSNDNELYIIFTEDINEEWNSAILFAVNYFYEHYIIANKKGLIVRVLDIQSQIVDTSSIIISYVTVMALMRILNFNISDFKLDENTGFIIFPK